jgi:hypothetical protein
MRGQIVGMRDHQIEPPPQNRRAILGRARGPALLRRLGRGDGARGLGPAAIGHMGNHIAAGGIADGKGCAGIRRTPLAAQKGPVAQQGGLDVSCPGLRPVCPCGLVQKFIKS